MSSCYTTFVHNIVQKGILIALNRNFWQSISKGNIKTETKYALSVSVF